MAPAPSFWRLRTLTEATRNFEYAPRNRGFDDFFGYFGAFGVYVNPTFSRNGVESVYQGYSTDILTTEACDYIEQQKAHPFFLHLAYTAAHLKQEAKPADLVRFAHLPPRRQMAAAIISNLDENMGRLLAALRQSGLDERTLLFFASDNGGEPLILGTLNGPFRGQKFDVYEGGIRVPFAVRWPGKIPAGRTFSNTVSLMDIFATSVKAAGAAPPPALDGVDLLPFLQGRLKGPPHEALFWRTTDHSKWRVLPPAKLPHFEAMRQGDWKLVLLPNSPPQLFNLGEDPGEIRNVAAQHPDRLRELQKRLTEWRRTLVDPMHNLSE